MTEERKPRVRFAPSPTGALHIGGAHTALFNWLWARHTGGSFVLRIEDTDRERSTAEYEQTIMDGLRWLGLDWDEGPDKGGGHGPYRQSERMELYRRYADELLSKGLAYKDGDAVIFRVPAGIDLKINDRIFGEINVRSENASMKQDGSIKDLVLIKSDGMPTYNYAVVVDDHTMDITCVIRGEDHIANTSKQMLIYLALGWEIPEFAHLPMILGRDKKKLSKRHGATSVFEYGDLGYTPESVFNFLALLGWSPGNDLEIFDRELATSKFELERVTKKPAVFDMDKLNHVNQEHMKNMEPAKRLKLVEPFWRKMGLDPGRFDERYLQEALTLMGGRAKTIGELAEYSDYFLDFGRVSERYDAGEIAPEAKPALREFFNAFLAQPAWDAAAMEEFSRKWCEEKGTKLKDIAMPLRWVLTGRKVSPGVFEVVRHLGREECRARLAHYSLADQ